MKMFDSQFNKNIFVNNTISKFPLEISSKIKASIPLDLISTKLNIDIICRKVSGDSFLHISFFKNKILLKTYKEIIDFNIFSNKKITIQLPQNADEMVIEKNKGSIGKIIINRIIISEEKEEHIELYSKIAMIVPYQMYGGAEVYLENLLKNSPQNLSIDLLINGANQISKAVLPKNIKIKNYLNNLFNFLNQNNYEQIIFYNSKKIYNDILSYKKINPSIKIYEIYHSDFVWQDSMSTVFERDIVDVIFKTSNLVGNNIIHDNQIVCPPPLEFNKFNFYRKTNNIKILGFIGRLSKEKDPLFSIDIANKLNMPLYIAGDGPLKGDVINYCKSKKNIHFFGWQNSLDFYKKIDCLIITSDMEGVPNVILEAIASGLPIISTNVGGISGVLNGTKSFLFNKNDYELKDIKNFIENNLSYNYENVLKAKEYDIDIIKNIFYKKIIEDFKNPIEINIKNNYKIINGMII